MADLDGNEAFGKQDSPGTEGSVYLARPRGVTGPLESAEDYVRGGVGSNPSHDERTAERVARATREEQHLRRWAFDRDAKTARTIKVPRTAFLGRGAEHEVYLDTKRNRVVKITRQSEPANFGFGISLNRDGQGATAGEYLDRLRLHNDIFNDDIRLEGVLPVAGRTKVITSQPFIKGEAAPVARIDAYMVDSKGFEPIGPGAYYHLETQILVHDLFPRNVLLTTLGACRSSIRPSCGQLPALPLVMPGPPARLATSRSLDSQQPLTQPRAMRTLLAALFAALLFCPAALRAADPAAADAVFKKMLAAQTAKDYDAFVADATDELKAALTKTQFEASSNILNARTKDGYDLAPLGSLCQHGYEVYLYRLRFPTGDDMLATLSLKDGKIGGIFFK